MEWLAGQSVRNQQDCDPMILYSRTRDLLIRSQKVSGDMDMLATLEGSVQIKRIAPLVV